MYMRNRIVRNNLLLICLLTVFLTSMVSCSKTKTPVISVPYVDTMGLLTAHKWTLEKFWFDMNNNGRIDSGETVYGLDFVHVYSFSAEGALRDSTVAYLNRTGTWTFKDNTKTAFYCNWNATTIDLYYIINISGTALLTKRYGTNESWYFVKE